MTHKRLVLSDIQTSDLLYYDPEFKEKCLDFCKKRNIDCLPALDDPKSFYRKAEGGFSEENVIESKMKVDSDTYIFELSLLECFQTTPLLFVYTKNELTGVVHFSDYNRTEVDIYLFGLLSAYEKSLRELLRLCGLKNQDMLEYFDVIVQTSTDDKKRSSCSTKKGKYKKYQSENKKLPLFECFCLLDLIELAKHKENIVLSSDTYDLRNKIMHANELVNKDDDNPGPYIYDLASFNTFFLQVDGLLKDYKKVNNRISFLNYAKKYE